MLFIHNLCIVRVSIYRSNVIRMVPCCYSSLHLPFATTWMDPEGIVLSKVSQRKTNTMFSFMWNLKTKENKLTRNRLTDTENILTLARRESGRGGG